MNLGLATERGLEGLFTAAGMAAALQDMAQSAGVDGATLTLGHGPVQMAVITSAGHQEHLSAYLDTDRPPDPRAARVNPSFSGPFRLDQDDFTDEEIARDPFYQEFLRPRGLGWHACALLAGRPGAETLHLTVRRAYRLGAFEPAELATLATALPLIRAASAITQMMGGLMGDAGDRDPQRAMFGFDSGRRAFALRQPAAAAEILRVRSGRLVAADPSQQARVSATIKRAHALAKPASVILYDAENAPWIFSVVPAAALAPAWMTPFVSWAVLAPCAPRQDADPARVRHIAGLFGLSAAEARVAALVGSGRTVATAAVVLSSSQGTIRNHLKSVFAKTGVTRQSELVALLARV